MNRASTSCPATAQDTCPEPLSAIGQRSSLGAPSVADLSTHPCYGSDAHRYYARMHVPVAPGCNIQCNYCNRKFDCSNESRPGVTTALLTPEQALARVKQVARTIGTLSVVGVAGPGEPLANAARTFGTLELIAREFPDLTLCLSTNGLTLLDHVDRIEALGIRHVTVTVNMIDPIIGAQIYAWITYGGKRYTGVEASKLLTERQLPGIEALASRGILCKVNSVLIPGINDEHLVEVSRTVRDLGAVLHNVMPLISAPEHGTQFALTGQREPTPRELQSIQDRCEAEGEGSGMTMMRHCRQCRADAIGLLSEDQGQQLDEPADDPTADSAPNALAPANGRRPPHDPELRRTVHKRIERRRGAAHRDQEHAGLRSDLAGRPARTLLLAVATTGGELVDQHFGRAEEFAVYEGGPGFARFVGTRSVSRYCAGPETCGHERSKLEGIAEMLKDCSAVICSQAGAEPRRVLAEAGLQIFELFGAIERAVAETATRLLATPEEDEGTAS